MFNQSLDGSDGLCEFGLFVAHFGQKSNHGAHLDAGFVFY